ncbi:prolyl oligopeptidase family serine peptidase [Microbacterium radiodurans]|uniref:S9 family peptidase n=1 Tax=Microbacterium radiodurans TaxID=661398 RepID=A0A5J5ISI5_9MICO|nr:prolyl oligopeptidase family serine peptidase [Microbacterium radiodurans]KAA9087260.1 S9 family peptidase [Microbacterium radiodurans]
MPEQLPYGSWPSPLTAAWASASALRLDGAAFVGDEIWWGESLPDEAGRVAVMRRRADGSSEVVLPAPANARSRVHEYGGGAWTVSDDGILYFVDKSDQRVRRLRPGGEAEALTPDEAGTHFGGLRWQRGTLLAVRERERDGASPERHIVAIATRSDDAADTTGDASPVTVVAGGSDFLAQPALSPDGAQLAWVAWDHPDMPWDRTRVRVARMGDPASARDITDGATAALQPEWVSDDELLLLDEPTGRWNVYRLDANGHDAAEAVSPADADTGGGLWVLGTRWYAPLADGRILAVRTHGSDELVLIDPSGRAVPLPFPATSRVQIEDVANGRALVSGSAPGAAGLWTVDLADGSVSAVRGGAPDIDDAWIPHARQLTVDGPHGPVHAFAYPPTNPDAVGDAGELPPYLVWVHGGPTAHVGGTADSKIAYFTSRGIGVLDVNYGGSTGYGRSYRDRLKGQWGVVDVDDVAAAARGLSDEGLADGARLAIEGGSAGGWTVLAALVSTDVFGAGISRYGVGDARALAAETHDFEARYLDGLIGPLPEAEDVYIERSPLSRPERFRVPLLLLQGDEDAVVPPAQAEAIRDALVAQGVPHAYVLYAGEGHGFRRTETVVHALESELAFLGRVFGFATPGVAPIELD